MFFDLLNGFRINGDFPIDSRFVVADEIARFSIPAGALYAGLLTFQEDNETWYGLKDISQANNAAGWDSIDGDRITSIDQSADLLTITIELSNGDSYNFQLPQGPEGEDAPFDLVIFGQFPENTIVAAPTGGVYTQSTAVLDLTDIDPSNWRLDTTGETLQTGNSWYSAHFRIIPSRFADVVNIPVWTNVQERTGETGPQGQPGQPGAPGDAGFTPRLSDNGNGTAEVTYITTAVPPVDSTIVLPQGEQGPQPPFRISLYRNGTASSVFAAPAGVVYDITNGTVDVSTIPSPWSLNRTDDAANPVRWESESDPLNPARFGSLASINMTFQTVFQEVEGGGGTADNIEVRTTGVTDTDTNIVYNASDKAATDLANVDNDLLGAEQLAFRNKVGAGDIRTNPTTTQIITQPTGTQIEFRGSIDFEDRDGNKALDFSGTSGDFHFEHEGEVYGLVDKDQKKIYYDTTNTATSFPTTGRAGKEIVIRDNLLRLANEITSIEIQRNSAGETLEQWEDAGNAANTFVNDPSNTLTEVSLANNLNLLANDSYSKMIVATENGNNYHFDLLRFQAVNGRLVLQTDNLVTRLANIDTAITNAGNNVTFGDNLGANQSKVVPANNWLVLPNTSRLYLYYNHGSDYTIQAGPTGLTLAQIAEFIETDNTLTSINYGSLFPYDVSTTAKVIPEGSLAWVSATEQYINLTGASVSGVDSDFTFGAGWLRLGDGGSGGSVPKSATLSSTDLPNPQEGDVVYLTADWTDTDGTKYYEGLHTYNGSLWVGVLNLPIISADYPAGLYDSSVPFLNDTTMLVEDITNAGIHRVGNNFELVGNWQTRTEDTNALVMDINVGNDSGDIDIYDGDAEVVLHLDSSGKKMYYGSNINTGSLVAGDELATISDISVKHDTITAYATLTAYAVDDWVYHLGELFRCTVAYTSPNAPATFGPQNQPEHWASVTENVNVIDTLVALTQLNTSAGTSATIRAGEMFIVRDDTDANRGLYLVLTTDNSNPPTAGTTVKKIAGLGGGGNDTRFDGSPEGLDHSDTGVTVGAVLDYNDPSTDTPYTIILPSADTYDFKVGQGVSATDEGTTYTIVRLQPTSTVTEFYIQGHHAAEFPAGTTLFVSEDGHKQNSIWTLPTQGASAYTQDDNVLNDLLAKEASLAEQVQANSTAIAAFEADLVSIAAYQPQGAYLSGAGDITPSYSTDQVDRSGSKTGTGYANTGAIRVYHNGDFEILTYLLMPEGTNTDGTGTNAPDVDYVSAFEEQFKTEDIIGHALVSGAYNTQGFPHVMNTTLETSYDNGFGTGLKAYFLGGVYQGRVEVRFQGTLTPSQNSDRTFITDHSDRTILYDNYTSYQIYPTNAFWHNVRIADPEQIFLIKEGVYLLHEVADAAIPANVGKVLAVEQDQNRVDTFNFPAGSNLSGDLSFTLSRPPNGNVTFSTVTGATITNTGSLVTFDYTGTVSAGSFTATYATTGVVAQGLGISGILSGGFTLMSETPTTVANVDVYRDVDNHFGDANAYYIFTGATSIQVGTTPAATTVVQDGWYKATVNEVSGTVTQLITIGDLLVAFK